jgi:hypothetical protein
VAPMHGTTVKRVRYSVVVRGRLEEHVVAVFDGVELEMRPGQTVVTGAFDQSRLHGLLDRLRDLGFELISVNPADPTVLESKPTEKS